LSPVCLSVAYIVNIHGAHSYWKQGALGAAGVRRVWTAAGPHRAQGWGHIVRLPAQLVSITVSADDMVRRRPYCDHL